MNIQTVGTENLPNVFIEEIFIYSNGDPMMNWVDQRIVVRLCMYDHKLNPSWMRPEMSDLRIKILFLSGDAVDTDVIADGLSSGTDSLYNYRTDVLDSYGHGYHVITVSAQDFVRDLGNDEYDKFKKTVEVTMNQPDSLNVYAACFIGGLNLGNDLLNRFYGPMSAERIYVGGSENKESSYFYYPDTNEEYGGPVHAHEDTWMEGSKHKSTPHKELRRVFESNYKISLVTGIVDPNELLPDEPGPQSGAGNEWEREALEGVVEDLEGNLVNMDPLEEIEEGPDESGPGPEENPDGGMEGY